MRLLIATPLYPPDQGGPATYAKLIKEHLPAKGVQVALVKFGDVRAYPRGIRHFLYFVRLLVAGQGADLLLALDPVSTGYPTMLAARFLRKPYVVKIVGDYAWEQGQQRFGITETLDVFVQNNTVPKVVERLRRIQKKVAARAKAVIVPSEYLKGIVHAWGIPLEHITVIYNAVEEEKGGAIPESLNAAHAPRIVWSSGRMVPWKGIDGIMLAVKSLRSSHPNLSLILVGDGPERARLEHEAAKQLGSPVFFTGKLSHADALAVMRTAEVYVLNSTYEGLSHSLIEALMLGLPIVATRAGGNTELIEDGVNGLLVPVGDTEALTRALEHLLTDQTLRSKLQTAALSSATHFSVPTMIEATHSFLQTLP